MNKEAVLIFTFFILALQLIMPAHSVFGGDNNTEDSLTSGLKNAKSPDERAEALKRLAGYYLPLKRLDKAVDAYRRTINDANIGIKEKYQYYEIIGDIYIEVNDYSSAIEFYQEAVSTIPKLEEARLKLANAYERADLNELAKQAYLNDLKVDKKSFDADFGLAGLYMKLGLDTQAMEYFRMALDIKTGAEIYRQTAHCAETTGDIAVACAMLRQIPASEMTYDDLIDLGRLYEENNKPKDAEETFSLAIKSNTGNISAYVNLALLYLAGNNLANAEKYLKIAIEKAPNEGSLHFFLGSVYSAQKRPEAALTEMRKASTLARTDILKTYSTKFEKFIPK